MRDAFAAELTTLAAADHRVVLLTADMGNRLFDAFRENNPDRFINCGVAEANMTGMAAGMAMCGLRPVTYTIAPFNTLRCLEQIKIDICYHNLPVVIVGAGAGLGYAGAGPTHQALEDIACLRVMPNISVICPGDAVEVRLALRAALGHDGPVYLRLGKKKEPVVHRDEPRFEIGRGLEVRAGSDACLLGTGNVLPLVLDTAVLLETKGVSARVVSMPWVKPLDEDLLADTFGRFEIVVTVEEHSVVGGFGGAVAEWLADHPGQPGRLVRFGLADRFHDCLGSQAAARRTLGLTPDALAARILKLLRPRLRAAGGLP
ncbi:MAG: transketolase C-terminal domain-containing protein [Thermodesulfobacteriota bacterium]